MKQPVSPAPDETKQQESTHSGTGRGAEEQGDFRPLLIVNC